MTETERIEMEVRIDQAISEFMEQRKHIFILYRNGKIRDVQHFNQCIQSMKEDIAERYSHEKIRHNLTSQIIWE
jgi:hypothetical protein